MKVDPTKDSACSQKQVREEAKTHNCVSDLSSPPSKREAEIQPKKRWGLSRSEWLGIIILALLTFWIWGSPPTNPTNWYHWFFYSSYGGVHTPMWTLYLFLVFVYLSTTRAVGNYKRHMLRDLFSGAVKVRGVSILAFSPESIAEKAGMHKGDVIIEYASEKDLTTEKLSAVVANRGPEESQVCVVFVRDRKQYSQTLPSGPLGISAMNTTVNVPVKSE